MTDRLFELAALDAAGALAPGEQHELLALMAAASPSALAAVADLYRGVGDAARGIRPGAAFRRRPRPDSETRQQGTTANPFLSPVPGV